MPSPIIWPEGKKFAFTIFDDTDHASLEKLRCVYDMLAQLGFRTTKSVWPLKGNLVPRIGGATCQDPEYFSWVKGLQERGFEVGFHNATYHTSDRGFTEKGLAAFREMFGHDPKTFANHAYCEEIIYFGQWRLSGLARLAYRLATRSKNDGISRGHLENDPLFWGDLCRDHVGYARNFVFSDINTLKACPQMPYHDPDRPYVNMWFASSEGNVASSFVRTISEENQDRLEAEGGACIMYTHLASGFGQGNEVDPDFKRLMTRLSRKDGWFVPVGVLLDYIVAQRGPHVLTNAERRGLEWRWLLHKFRVGSN